MFSKDQSKRNWAHVWDYFQSLHSSQPNYLLHLLNSSKVSKKLLKTFCKVSLQNSEKFGHSDPYGWPINYELFGQPETLKIRRSKGQIFFFLQFYKDRATGRLWKLREVYANSAIVSSVMQIMIIVAWTRHLTTFFYTLGKYEYIHP